MKSYFRRFKSNESQRLTDQLALLFARQSGPARQRLETAINEKDYKALVDWSIDYNDDWDAVSLYAARQCLALYQKCDDLDIGVDKEAVAWSKFVESEQACKHANERLRISRFLGYDRGVASVLFAARRKIERIIGSSPPKLAELQFAFGPGANVNVQKNTSARWKLSAKPACSANMVGIVDDVLAEVPAYTSLHCNSSYHSVDSWLVDVEVLPGKLMFVPKNAKTHRSIIGEPSLNTLVQKGYGSHLKELLKKAGIDLTDQTVNRRRARVGSLDGSLMTVDLSSASDTICRELVFDLLPLDWYLALSRCRTSSVVYDENSIQLEKFSSMGNGFTFELESLIFYALTWACCHEVGCRPDVSVYGDDIICPPDALDAMNRVFSYCGFTINTGKSFYEGPFRESCGADYYKGVNVRPFYNKTRWSPATLTAFHNFLVGSDWSMLFPEALELVLSGIPPIFHNYGPAGFGDGHLIGAWSPEAYRRDRGWSGYTFTTYIQKTKRVRTPCVGDDILPHYVTYLRMSDEESFNPYVVRGENGEKRISVYTLGRY